MQQNRGERGFSRQELESQDLVELPQRELMLAVTVLGIPVVGLTGIDIRIS